MDDDIVKTLRGNLIHPTKAQVLAAASEIERLRTAAERARRLILDDKPTEAEIELRKAMTIHT